MPKKESELGTYRSQIDAIDNSILELLAKRVKIVRQVGALKQSMGKKGSIIRPGREAEMVRRIARQGKGDMPHAAALAQMWRLIISSAINIEENPKIATVSTPANRDCYWLAREYFGAFTPTVEKATVAEVVQDVVDGKATVGVMPLFGKEGPSSWWCRIEGDSTESHPVPKIFAKIPFVQFAPSAKEPLVAIGYVEPEETGEDESLWVIRTEERVGLPALEKLLKQEGIDYAHMETCRVLGVATTHHHLLKVKGFMAQDNSAIAAVVAKANGLFPKAGSNISAHYLGSYAVPLLLEE